MSDTTGPVDDNRAMLTDTAEFVSMLLLLLLLLLLRQAFIALRK